MNNKLIHVSESCTQNDSFFGEIISDGFFASHVAK